MDLETANDPFTRGTPPIVDTNDPLPSIRYRSFTRSGLWSCVSSKVDLDVPQTALASPAPAAYIWLL